MMKLFIAEDEAPARERLTASLARVAPEAQVVGHSDTVRGTLDWLARHPAPDLLLADIQLADGLSLELFRGQALRLPTIFTTAYDQFALQAFQAMAVDYLLKPVSEAALAQALAKAARWREHFDARAESQWQARLDGLLERLAPPRQRLIGRKAGQHFHALALDEIAYFVSLDKLSFAIGLDGERYQVEPSLGELEAQLPHGRFFRANRQVLVGAGAVRSFAPAGKGRLQLTLTPPLVGELLISQERTAAFRAWLEG